MHAFPLSFSVCYVPFLLSFLLSIQSIYTLNSSMLNVEWQLPLLSHLFTPFYLFFTPFLYHPPHCLILFLSCEASSIDQNRQGISYYIQSLFCFFIFFYFYIYFSLAFFGPWRSLIVCIKAYIYIYIYIVLG